MSSQFADWVGRTESRTERIFPERVAALAATLDLAEAPAEGSPLPPAWHWAFFNPFVRAGELGPDGHPERGGFLPPVDLPRRMWAGGRVRILADLPVGALAVRESRIESVEPKEGRQGRLVFVTVRHAISVDGRAVVEEDQNIVYREPADPSAPAPAPVPPKEAAAWTREITPDPVLLFRYSALTSNGHRIHYDHPYTTAVEHYPDLVVHGPLSATLLVNAAAAEYGRAIKAFGFRGLRPLFVSAPFTLNGAASGDAHQAKLWAAAPDGGVAMTADVEFG